ncbi:hypothetical protein NIES4071_13440 [Calothrix sp. NIES-4071]|nr:hypothetical protein NIES4071_13440 [Calothrix sp. NIES-4071]BAZ55683.1 hypothetical protein NIES4105_13400 [Calothrix sp. NIES-4105]
MRQWRTKTSYILERKSAIFLYNLEIDLFIASMTRRFYVVQLGSYWSLTKHEYLKLLQHGAVQNLTSIDLNTYQARVVKKPPLNAKPIDLSGFEVEHFQMELEHFMKTGEQTGFDAEKYINIFFE